ncbi:response regulator [Bradyrhizobium elkanii]|uniref:Response regulator n=1 Tax=Bradyrhizobium elkanii TaxID=29448 RepID=A0A4U6RVL5_BRAEL|nr:response regulator [Bradyrhizobium elkanii]TKV78318.1 response regulator [Bradyrhizobium elkanii]
MSKGGRVVAVVDDDPRLVESLAELLESAGYHTCCFSSAQALLAAGFANMDVLITDVGIPGVDGFELRRRALKQRPDLPVFLISGRHEVADQSRAQGLSGFFRKPFDGRALLAAVDDALRGGGEGKNED